MRFDLAMEPFVLGPPMFNRRHVSKGRGPHFAPTGRYNPGSGDGAERQAQREFRRRAFLTYWYKDTPLPSGDSRQVRRATKRATAKDIASCSGCDWRSVVVQ